MRYLLLLVLFWSSLSAQTIREKKENLQKGVSDLSPELNEALLRVNRERKSKEEILKTLFDQGAKYYEEQEDLASYKVLLEKIRDTKEQIALLDRQWQDKATNLTDEPYALWHQPDTTIEQLVIDYGSQDFVYLISPEIADIKLSISSSLPVPRSAWFEMLETILAQNGVGIDTLNPYLKRLYKIAEDRSGIRLITGQREELALFGDQDRVCFVMTPDLLEFKKTLSVLEKFANKESQAIEQMGRFLLIFSSVGELEELLKLFDFMDESSGDKEFALVTLCRLNAEEMAKMLSVLFDDEVQCEGASAVLGETHGLKILVMEHMPRALFLVGSKREVARAEEIIKSVECQAGHVREKELYWYTAKYTDPEELAQVLERVYNMMVCDAACGAQEPCIAATGSSCESCYPEPRECSQNRLYDESFYQKGDVVVNPAPVELSNKKRQDRDTARQNFIVDQKTGSIVMVVEADLLPKMKETIRRLDIPKKMVQIEVLLFEKKSSDRNRFDLNVLKMGAAATNTHQTGLLWNDLAAGVANKGILEFFLSRPKTGWFPAFDLDYKFLLSQEDIQINSAPSVLTLNQTPAQIAIVDEISINTGIYDVETTNSTVLKDAFTRAQYGINLTITPTVHTSEERSAWEDPNDYITLETKVNFDTIQPNSTKDRPDVTRRKIENEAVIADGQSVILGGLRRKQSANMVDKIPFLGDIPCIGKLFSTTDYRDQSTEMFIMITPKIVRDPKEELNWIKREEMKRRPGDLPDYLCRLSYALKCERERLFEGTFTLLFGPRGERCYTPGWHEDAFDY